LTMDQVHFLAMDTMKNQNQFRISTEIIFQK
jgi:hypothetical protein